MKNLFFLSLTLSLTSQAYDFSLQKNGPCGGRPCQEKCTYDLAISSLPPLPQLSSTAKLETEFNLTNNASSNAQVLLSIPGLFEAEEIVNFGNDTAAKIYYLNFRSELLRVEYKWARIEPGQGNALTYLIKARKLSDFDDDLAKLTDQKAKEQILGQKSFIAKYWNSFGADWQKDFDAKLKSGLPLASRREDMDIVGYDKNTVSPFYLTFLASRFANANLSANFFLLGKRKKEPNLRKTNFTVQNKQKFLELNTTLEYGDFDLPFTIKVDSATREITALEFTATSGSYFGKIWAKLTKKKCEKH